MSVARCHKHDRTYDTDFDDVCPKCGEEPEFAPKGSPFRAPHLKWLPGIAWGYRLMEGDHCRAVILPTTPYAWNGYARWRVQATGLPCSEQVRTLREAKILAEVFA